MTLAQHGLFGSMETPVDVTYISDSVMMLRYFEAMGQVRRAVSMVKKRSGNHERTIREYCMGSEGIVVGKSLAEFQGVMTGVPTYRGEQGAMLHGSGDADADATAH